MVSQPAGTSERPQFDENQKAAIFRTACRRVIAAVRREPVETARSQIGEIAETPVYGSFVTLRRDGRLRSCCGCIESSIPLGRALDIAADRAATDDPRFPPIESDELDQLHVDVWILWGPEPVSARGEDRVQAVTIGKHGLLISRGYARGLLLPGVAVEHHLDARAFLEQVCLKAGLPTDAWLDDDTQLLVFEGDSIEGPMASEGPEARQPAVAGGFYPKSPREVRMAVKQMMAAAPAGKPEPWAGVLTPHAGWMYSGRLAAAVFHRVAIPERAIVFCPRHRSCGARWAVAPYRRWLFPGGQVAADPALAARLADAITGLTLDADAHRDEHAIEVQLPLLSYLAPSVRVTGITIGGGSLSELLQFGDQLAGVLGELPNRPLLIVSSDMNHFADDVETRRLDRLAIEAIESLDPARVYETVEKNGISMCGAAGCVIAMETLRQLGCLTHCELVGHATSAEAGGPTDRVVGYAGMLFR